MALILRPNVELNYYNTIQGTKNNQENRELIYKWVSVAIILVRSLTVNIT